MGENPVDEKFQESRDRRGIRGEKEETKKKEETKREKRKTGKKI